MTPVPQQSLSMKPITNNKGSSRVLVVEDNMIAQTVGKAILSSMSCQVDIASNGVDALKLCENNQYDLIFMDIGLGEGMDGYEVTHHIRTLPNAMNQTPIVALTAHGGDENIQRCIRAGMDAVLTKPLTQILARDILKTFIPTAPNIDLNKVAHDDDMFQLQQFALLDNKEALKNCGSQSMLVDLLQLMIQELPSDLRCMKNAYASTDYPLVEKIAHKIKGGAVYVGTTRMKFACQYVEQYWKSGQRQLFDKLYHQATNTIQDTCNYLNEWLQKNQ